MESWHGMLLKGDSEFIPDHLDFFCRRRRIRVMGRTGRHGPQKLGRWAGCLCHASMPHTIDYHDCI